MDLDLAFSQKKRGKRVVQKCDAAAACLSSVVYSSRFCLSLLVWALGLLLLGELSPQTQAELQESKPWQICFSCSFIHPFTCQHPGVSS